MSAKKKIAIVVFGALMSFTLAFLGTGYALDKSKVHSELRMSFTSATDQNVNITVTNQTDSTTGTYPNRKEQFSIITQIFYFNYPATILLSGTNNSAAIHINHLGIKTQKRYKDWDATQITEAFTIGNADYKIVENVLVLQKQVAQKPVSFKLKNEEAYANEIAAFHQNIKIYTAFAVMMLFILFALAYFINPKKSVKSGIVALIAGVLAFLLFQNWSDERTPLLLDATFTNAKNKQAKTQQFVPVREIQNLTFAVPVDHVELSNISLTLKYSWLSWPIKGQDVLQSFAYLNQIKTTKNSLKATDSNCFVQLSNADYVNKFKWLSLALQATPFFAFLVVFFINFNICQYMFKKYSQSINMWVLNIAFLNFIFIPMAAKPISQTKLQMESEKRTANQLPNLNNTTLDNFPQAFNNYIEDQFIGRDFLITSYNRINQNLFSNGNLTTKAVAEGKDGWLFYTELNTDEIYENKAPFTAQELEDIVLNLKEREYWLKKRGIDFFLVILPLKHTMYEEYLPDDIYRHNMPPKIDTLISYIRANSNIKLIDVREALFEAKKKMVIYFKVDTHWNMPGALAGYQEIINQMRVYYPELGEPLTLDDFEIRHSTTNEGDLAGILNMKNELLRQEILIFPKEPYKHESGEFIPYPDAPNGKKPRFYQVPESNKPKIFWGHDSFSGWMIPFLSNHFSNSTYYWSYSLNEDIVEQEKPDIMVTELMERFMYDLAIPNSLKVKMEYKAYLDSLETHGQP